MLDFAQEIQGRTFFPRAEVLLLRQGALITSRQAFVPRAIALLLLVILAVFSSALPAAAESAKSLYNKGKDAEARQNYEAAYDFYKQAYDQKPKDTRYRSAYDRIRFYAAASKVHR